MYGTWDDGPLGGSFSVELLHLWLPAAESVFLAISGVIFGDGAHSTSTDGTADGVSVGWSRGACGVGIGEPRAELGGWERIEPASPRAGSVKRSLVGLAKRVAGCFIRQGRFAGSLLGGLVCPVDTGKLSCAEGGVGSSNATTGCRLTGAATSGTAWGTSISSPGSDVAQLLGKALGVDKDGAVKCLAGRSPERSDGPVSKESAALQKSSSCLCGLVKCDGGEGGHEPRLSPRTSSLFLPTVPNARPESSWRLSCGESGSLSDAMGDGGCGGNTPRVVVLLDWAVLS